MDAAFPVGKSSCGPVGLAIVPSPIIGMRRRIRERPLERLVIWWCHLIGITDEQAIHYAVGAVGAGTFLLGVVALAWLIFMGSLLIIHGRQR
jgi:hypothetical protein